ncbi:MAG: PAS domain-containing protein [Oceanicaulis sp.]
MTRTARASATAALFEAVFDGLEDAAAVLDAEHRLVAANARFRDLLGDEPATGRAIEAVLSEPAEAAEPPWRRDRAPGPAWPVGLKLADGGRAGAECRVRALPGGARLVTFRLIAEIPRRRAEAERRLADAFAEPRDGAFSFDLETGRGRVSGLLARLLGLEDGESAVEIAALREAVHSDDRAGLDGWLKRPADAPDLRLRLKASGTGEFRYVRFEGRPSAFDAEGGAIRLAGTASDVSDLAAAEAALAVSEARLDHAAALGGLSPWMHDFDSGESWVEGQAADRFPPGAGFSPAAFRRVVHPDDLQGLTAAFLSMAFGAALDRSFRVRRGDGDWETLRVVGSAEPGAPARASGFVRVEDDLAGQAVRSAGVSAWIYDVQTRTVRLEGEVLNTLGLPGPVWKTPVEAWRARVPNEDLASMDRATRDLVETGLTETEYRVRTEGGQHVWLALRGGVSEQDASGAPLRYSGFITEIGPNRMLERQVAARESQLRDAVSAGLIGAWSIDLVTNRQAVFGEIAGWMGLAEGETAAGPEHWRAVIHPDDLPKALAAFRDFQEGRDFDRFDYRLKSPDGWRWARTTGRIVDRTSSGRPLRAAGIILDTESEYAFAEALDEERERYETFYKNTPALLCSINEAGQIVMVSDHWIERMGFARAELIGQPASIFIAPEERARAEGEIMRRSWREGSITNEPVVLVDKSGARVEARLSAFWETDAEGRKIRAHGVFSEVGDLNAARRELEDRATALERANRELDRFATVASHDLQEPLRKISAFASLLRRRYEGRLDADADRFLDYLVDAAGRMRRLIDDLLAYSRASSRPLAPEPVDLQAVWDEVAAGQAAVIEEARAALDVAPLPPVKGDRVLLQLLISNLLSNALKYRKSDGVKVSVTCDVADGRVRLVFEDDGIGFDPRFSQKVFEPFARLHPRDEYEGTGIGLAICQQAAERMGGTISVDSAPGRGARFIVDLPAAEPVPAAASGP